MQTTKATATVTVQVDEVRAVVAEALERAGAVAREAAIQGEHLVQADLRGHPSHGIFRLPVLVGRLRSGAATSGLPPERIWRTDAALAVDGRRGLGPAVVLDTLEAILARAAETGVAMASIRNAGHVGMLAPYLERMALSGCAGVILTVSEALVHPWGGSTAMIGTNPIGIGVPTLGAPVVVDMSTAQVSAGKILDYAARGEDIPLGWAVDEQGNATTDAAAAARGALSPFGGPKGYALGLALEALVGLLAGSAFGADVHGTLDTDRPPTKGDLVMAFSLDALGAKAGLAPLAEYLDAVRASGVSGPVSIPGERARREAAGREAAGVPLDVEVWQRAVRLSEAAAA